MSSGFYLLDNPNPNYPQYREDRRNGKSATGTFVVHTAENTIDLSGEDSGAESVAAYIARRTTPGSYHFLADSDSLIFMAPINYETWHDTATNNFSYGGSAAVQAGKWDTIPEERRYKILDNLAAGFASAAKWLKENEGITVPAKRITKAQAHAGKPGFLGHGDSDPKRRSDPGKEFDWDYFLAEYKRLVDGGDKPKPSKPTKPSKPAKPSKPSGKAWPDKSLKLTDEHTAESHKAWVKLLKDVGYKDRDLTKNFQRWLRDLGYYNRAIDGDFGKHTVIALQRFLARKGLYKRKVDGQRGRHTVRAEIQYLNNQARMYK